MRRNDWRPPLCEISGAQQPAGIGANEKRRIGPRAHEIAVVPAAADHHMRKAERERPVGARANAQPKIGLAAEPDIARIDDDELHPALERRDRRGRVRQARVGGVVTPKDQAAAISDVRHRPAAAGRWRRSRHRTRSAWHSLGPSRTCPAARRGSACRRRSSADAGRLPNRRLRWWRGRLAEGHARGPCAAASRRIAAAVVSRASSQEISTQPGSASPFGRVRRNGRVSRCLL